MTGRETEIKVKVASLEEFRERLQRAGFHVHKPRVFERNTILDTDDLTLRQKGCLLRVRECDGRTLVTFKGPATVGRFKSREEVEFEASDASSVFRIFLAMGHLQKFIYEKYRTEYIQEGEKGIVMLDETPIGEFAEIEGEERWIDTVAEALGLDASNYITDSYGSLYRKWCESRLLPEGDMIFHSAERGAAK
jgi:adenylate cyclase class 2